MNKFLKYQSIFIISFILLIIFSIITPLIVTFLGEAYICYDDNDPKKINCNQYKSSPKIIITIIIVSLIISIIIFLLNLIFQFGRGYYLFEYLDENNIEIPYTFIDNFMKKN